MMLTLRSYARRSKRWLHRLLADPRSHLYLRAAAWFLCGFVLSAASLDNRFLPLSMGLVLACSGWPAILSTAGGALGLLLFWGNAGYQGLAWLLAALPLALAFGNHRIGQWAPYLQPALGALVVSAVGVVFQI